MPKSRIVVDVEKAQQLLSEGHSWRGVARQLGVSPRTLKRRIEEAKSQLRGLNEEAHVEAVRKEIRTLEERLQALSEALRARWAEFTLEDFDSLRPASLGEDSPIALYQSQAREAPEGELKEALECFEGFLGRLRALRRTLSEEKEFIGNDALHGLYARFVPALERQAKELIANVIRASSHARWEIGQRLTSQLQKEVQRAEGEASWAIWRHLAALWLPKLGATVPDLVLGSKSLVLALCLEMGPEHCVEEALQRREPHLSLLSAALPKETKRTLRHLRACETLETRLRELSPRGLATRIVV